MNNLFKRLIIFLIRKRLELRKHEAFRFANQKSDTDFYYFTDTILCKVVDSDFEMIIPSSVSLNWLLDDDCQIEILKPYNWEEQ